ncbi:uncharacterized protein P884DRAFT_329098 [Thermothelomyces heterothallicus CBS 202.75]|uniref:uncharacterized protein n=1 Tax=Thermothelomyces heterothallicus CBS 202.75 TaxID=1149848 RepID=UPI00374380DC
MELTRLPRRGLLGAAERRRPQHDARYYDPVNKTRPNRRLITSHTGTEILFYPDKPLRARGASASGPPRCSGRPAPAFPNPDTILTDATYNATNPLDAENVLAIVRAVRAFWASPSPVLAGSDAGPHRGDDPRGGGEETRRARRRCWRGGCGCGSWDASIIPLIIISGLQATVYAVAEKGGDILKHAAPGDNPLRYIGGPLR